MAKIAFIGLGNMGGPMAQNLVKAGHIVIGADVSPEAVERLVAAGGQGAGNLGRCGGRGRYRDHHAAVRPRGERNLSQSGRRSCTCAARYRC